MASNPGGQPLIEMKAKENGKSEKKIGHFNQVNLTANRPGYGAANIDPTLINAWGIAFNGGNVPWVNAQGGHVSEIYSAEGVPVGIGRVRIPLPNGADGGNPTGIVFNASATDFLIPGGPARFIFVGVDGVLSAWNGSAGTKAIVRQVVPQAAFTGLTLGKIGGNTFLYAANFSARKINVWDRNFQPVNLPFVDPNIPAGYSPYNIENIDGMLYVAYSKVAPDGRSQSGDGLGYVDIFHPNGVLAKRFASGGSLNNPWGIAKAPAGFFGDDHDDDDDKEDGDKTMILIGNFGNGRINAYRSDGKFKGQLRGDKDPISIDGLWAITFVPAASTINPGRLYFAAGPADERDGLFGYIIARPDHDD
jgi:uncharacterized protein (TIGR03118 family)